LSNRLRIKITPMNEKYEIKTHKDGYVVTEIGAPVGISTHKSILDALATCRIANVWARRADRAERINYAETPAFLKVQAT